MSAGRVEMPSNAQISTPRQPREMKEADALQLWYHVKSRNKKQDHNVLEVHTQKTKQQKINILKANKRNKRITASIKSAPEKYKRKPSTYNNWEELNI